MQKSIVIVCIAVIFLVMTTGCSNNTKIETLSMPTQEQSIVGSETQQTPMPNDNDNDSKDSKSNSPLNSPSVLSEDMANVPFNANKYLTDEEFVFDKGVRLEMSYEEVFENLGGYDEIYNNGPGVKSIKRNGVHYGFYESDGVYRLKYLNLSESSNEIFPRGIKVGDKIEDVLNKFPGNDKTLRKWAQQYIYGEDHIGDSYAKLEFKMYDECYHFSVKTPKCMMIVNFDRENRVRFIEIYGEGL